MLQAVLDAGGDPTPEGLYGWTPLQCAQKKRKEDSGHAKAIEAAIVEWEAKRQAKYQTLALLVVLAIAMEVGGKNVSGGYRWLACSSPFSVYYWKKTVVDDGRGGSGLDEDLDSIYDDECDVALFTGRIFALVIIAWMVFLAVFWFRNRDTMRWRSM